jgi:hypothetical protein
MYTKITCFAFGGQCAGLGAIGSAGLFLVEHLSFLYMPIRNITIVNTGARKPAKGTIETIERRSLLAATH